MEYKNQPVSQPVLTPESTNQNNQGQPGPQGVSYTQVPLVNQGGLNILQPALVQGFIADPLAELAQCTGAIVRQQPDYMSEATSCDRPAQFHVYVQTPYGIKYLFKCNEISSGCARCCCGAASRGYSMDIKHIKSETEMTADLADDYISIRKPCSCCLCRPTMEITEVSNGAKFGKIRDPFCACTPEVDIYDRNDNLRYEISTECCQEGLCCGAACSKLNDIRFHIFQNGNRLGDICKLQAGYDEFFTKADSYLVKFPPIATPEDRMMLIVATLLLDYQYFALSGTSDVKK